MRSYRMPFLSNEAPKTVGGIMTLKQFTFAGGGVLTAAALLRWWWSLPSAVLAVIAVALGSALAFVNLQGLSLDRYFMFAALHRLAPTQFPYRKHAPSAQTFLEFDDIQNGILRLPDGGRRLVLEVTGAVNYGLLNQSEQERVEGSFRALIRALQWPVQFYVQMRLLDLDAAAREVRARIPSLPAGLQQYAQVYAGHLHAWTTARSVFVRRNYLVLTADHADPVTAEQELRRRQTLVAAELSKFAKCAALDTERLTEMLYVLYNKSRATVARVEDAAPYGFLDPVIRKADVTDAAPTAWTQR